MTKDIILIDNALYTARKDEYGLRVNFKGYPHMGLAYLSGTLRQHNIDFEVWDLSFDKLQEEKICNCKYVGLTAMTHNISETFRLAREIKKINSNIKVILGGVHGTVLPQETLEECESIDIIVKGEGELVLLDILINVNYKDIKGISYRENGSIIHNPLRAPIADLDSIPFPAWDIFDLKKYAAFNFYSRPLNTSVTQGFILGSRGCIYPCNFCYRFMGNDATQIRFRSAENIRAEIKQLIDNFGVNYIGFTDASMVMNIKFFYNLIKIIKEFDVFWNGSFRANEINEEIMETVKGTKLDFVAFGVESLSDEQLKNMNKKITYETVCKAIALLRNYSFKICISLIIGYPGETEETLKTTYKRAKEIGFDVVSINMANPYPGTVLYNNLKDKKTPCSFKDGIGTSWEKFNRKDILIESPFISDELLYKYFNKIEINLPFYKIKTFGEFVLFIRFYFILLLKRKTPWLFNILFIIKSKFSG